MKKFEVGKTYRVNGNGKITITKRTNHYITFHATWISNSENDFDARKEIHAFGDNGLFGLGENVIIPSENTNLKYYCFAGHIEN